jgi:[protein-PII] uridylyltransferase
MRLAARHAAAVAADPMVDIGAAARDRRAADLRRWLASLLPAWPDGVALVATGGLGRGDCGPRADLDLLLVHDGHPGIGALAEALWYPIWDAGVPLDHSVRTVPEALSLAAEEVKVALALLDARHVAGDAALAGDLRTGALDLWRRTAHRGLPVLWELARARWTAHGELAFLLEGDVKEARGGLRDVGLLRAVSAAGVAHGVGPAVRAAHRRLLDVRDALHVVTGRRLNRLVAQEREAVAGLLGHADGDALLRRVGQDARAVAYALDDAWRSVDRWRAGRMGAPGPPQRRRRRPIGRDVVEQDGEAVLARTAVGPRPDPDLPLRVAAAAATAGLPVARATLEWLARFTPPLPVPWPASARQALLRLLGSGPGLVPVWEACDRHGLVATWLPEWTRLRSLPQHNPVHRYTVDRHLVQAAAEAAAYVREVPRPDLLVLGALLHDIGKGLPGDHSEAGARVAASIAARIGLPARDVATIVKLVRLHLLLPEAATRRDIADPATAARVAQAVGDVATLDLLHAITRADAAATGPAAWSVWKGRLVAGLVDRVRVTLRTGAPPPPPAPDPALVAGDLPVVGVGADEVSVAAPDRRGLLAAVAGCLALHRLEVVAADMSTIDGRALVRCAVQPRYGAPPDRTVLAADLRRAVVDRLPGLARLATRRGAGGAGPGGADGRARVTWHRDATDATVLQVHAADAPGLLYRLARALEEVGADVRAARISTFGGAAVDAFYLVGPCADPRARGVVEAAVLAAAS